MARPVRSRQQRLAALRKDALGWIKVADQAQEDLWEGLEVAALAADREVHGREHEIIWATFGAKAEEGRYPLWMDALLVVITMAIPVNSLLSSLGKQFELSRTLPLMTRRVPVSTRLSMPVSTRLSWLQRAGPRVVLTGEDELRSIVIRSEFRGRRIYGTLLGDEALRKHWVERWIDVAIRGSYAEDMVRGLVGIAAKAATTPLFQPQQAPPHPVRRAASAAGAALPSTMVFTAMLEWIKASRRSDGRCLELLAERVSTSEDEEFLSGLQEFIGTRLTPESEDLRAAPPEWFMRFVEACLWCTTFDFTPAVVPRHQEPWPGVMPLIAGGEDPTPQPTKEVEPTLKVLPLPKEMWNYLTARHYDPHFKDGTKTYAEAGNFDWIAPEDKFSPAQLGPDISKQSVFTPEMRLSLHWSGILAPELLQTNRDVAAIIDDHLRQPP